MIKVSVIIPVFNSEKYIERCIESIINQTLRDIEIICIDDCSRDTSLKILKQYGQIDARIRIYHNEFNLGAAACRNKALELAKGKYIQFVDADDFLDQNALESLYCDAEENKVDMCFFKMKVQHENVETGFKELPRISNSYRNVLSGKKILAIFIENNDFFYYACMVFYRRDFLNENYLRFKKITIGEGGDLILRALTVAERVIVNDGKYYNYYIHLGSITNRDDKNKLPLFGQITQYISMLKYMAGDVDSEEIFDFLNFQMKKINGGISNLSNEETIDFEGKLEDKFSEHIFKSLLSRDVNYDIVLQDDELKQIRQSENVILFGAGYALKDVMFLLNKYEIEIIGIAVSDKKNNPKSLYGHHIYEITEILEYNRNSIVIVTANSKYRKEIERTLNINGFYNRLFLNIVI